jgi:hypothetical protein
MRHRRWQDFLQRKDIRAPLVQRLALLAKARNSAIDIPGDEAHRLCSPWEHASLLETPNASLQLLPEAGARHERTL